MVLAENKDICILVDNISSNFSCVTIKNKRHRNDLLLYPKRIEIIGDKYEYTTLIRFYITDTDFVSLIFDGKLENANNWNKSINCNI